MKRANTIAGKIIAASIFALILAWIFSTFAFPFILTFAHPNMQVVIGNPKAIYMYDISPSCNEGNIKSSLLYLSSNTGVHFIGVPYPLALPVGGIDYTCNEYLNGKESGESETGWFAASYFVITWDKIRLIDDSRNVVIHETLHSMGFGHSNDQNSIMYPMGLSNQHLDENIISFLRTYYTNNPFAYLNILTLNIVIILTVSTILLCSIAISISPKEKNKHNNFYKKYR